VTDVYNEPSVLPYLIG